MPSNLFPLCAIPPVLRDYVVAVASQNGVDPIMPFAAGLATVSMAIGRRTVIRSSRGDSRLNLFIELLAVTGAGFSISTPCLFEPLTKKEEKLHKDFHDQYISNECALYWAKRILRLKKPPVSHYEECAVEARIRENFEKEEESGRNGFDWLRKHVATLKRDHQPVPGIVADAIDVSILLTRLHENDDTYAIISTHSNKMLLGFVCGQNPFIKVLNRSFSGERIASSNENPSVRSPCLAILVAMRQPSWAQFIAEHKGESHRLAAKFLVFNPQRIHARWESLGTPPNPSVVNKWNNLVTGLIETRHEDRVINIAGTSAESLLMRFENDINSEARQKGGLYEMLSMTAAENAARLTGILHVMEHGTSANKAAISELSAQTACDLVRYSIETACLCANSPVEKRGFAERKKPCTKRKKPSSKLPF